MEKTFEFAVFIGRFEPFHHGHQYIVQEALKQAAKIIVLIGSANSPRTLKNPFTFAERAAMIKEAMDNDPRIICAGIDDDLYNDNKWLQNIQCAVQAIAGKTPADKIAIIGHQKDNSSYYLSLFVQWQLIALPNLSGLSATPMRGRYFADGAISEHMPTSSAQLLQEFLQTQDYQKLQREYNHIQAYQKAWQSAPYPPVFVTADALVVQAGHLLVVERGGEYGQGLLALAGGFLNQEEDLLTCAKRELLEETGLSVDDSQLKQWQLFDSPSRSLRARTVTTVFHFELSGASLPVVQGADDANRAFWLPLNQLDGRVMFEDHYSIIKKMLNL